MAASVLIADDHPIVLGGLRAAIDADPQFRVVASAADGDAALRQIATLQPDVAVLDLNMPGQTGLQVLTKVRDADLSTAIIILAAAATEAEIHAIVTAGARGLLFKESAPRVLLDCLAVVVQGDIWLSPDIEQIVSKREQHNRAWQDRMQLLTDRELDLVRLVGEGRSNKEIAYQLHLSEGTVKVHLNNIFRKFNVSTRSELADLTVSSAPPLGPLAASERRR